METTIADRSQIRTLVRGAYDLQKLRISTGNRVVANFRAKLGQAPGESEEDALDEKAKKILADLKKRHRRITDALIAARHKGPFPGDEIISTYTDFALVAQYTELERTETEHFKRLKVIIEPVPIYREFLEPIPGVGPAIAGFIISEFDIHQARYPSSLWKYAGLDVVAEDGLGRSRRKEHLVKKQYTNAKGQPAERDSITYNAWLKTKLMGVLGPSLLRAGSERYATIYREYRHRLETDPARTVVNKPGFHRDENWTKMRRHQAAMRKMVKQFLVDLYNAWRPLEGLSVAPTYHEAKLGHRHRDDSRAA